MEILDDKRLEGVALGRYATKKARLGALGIDFIYLINCNKNNQLFLSEPFFPNKCGT
jgi:hypothetical protein